METERKCNFKVTATHGQCQLQVLHAVSAQAYDQVNYAQARYLAANNITQAHVDYIRGHNQVGVSDNAGSYRTHAAYNFSSSGSGRRLSVAAGGDLFVPNGHAAVGTTFYRLKNGANYDNSELMGASDVAGDQPSSHSGWVDGAYSP